MTVRLKLFAAILALLAPCLLRADPPVAKDCQLHIITEYKNGERTTQDLAIHQETVKGCLRAAAFHRTGIPPGGRIRKKTVTARWRGKEIPFPPKK